MNEPERCARQEICSNDWHGAKTSRPMCANKPRASCDTTRSNGHRMRWRRIGRHSQTTKRSAWHQRSRSGSSVCLVPAGAGRCYQPLDHGSPRRSSSTGQDGHLTRANQLYPLGPGSSTDLAPPVLCNNPSALTRRPHPPWIAAPRAAASFAFEYTMDPCAMDR